MSDRKGHIVEGNMDRLIEHEAQCAVEELEKRTNVLTPVLIKGVIEKRLRAFLGPGVALPQVSVGVRRRELGGGFDIEIKPAQIDGITIKHDPAAHTWKK